MPVFAHEGLAALLEQHGVVVSAVPAQVDPPLWRTLVPGIAPVVLLGGLVLIGAGASHESALAPALFVGGILAVGLGYLLPMIGAHER